MWCLPGGKRERFRMCRRIGGGGVIRIFRLPLCAFHVGEPAIVSPACFVGIFLGAHAGSGRQCTTPHFCNWLPENNPAPTNDITQETPRLPHRHAFTAHPRFRLGLLETDAARRGSRSISIIGSCDLISFLSSWPCPINLSTALQCASNQFAE